MPADEALARLARYESLFELSSEINTANDIARVGDVMARRLKYVADVFSWRYLGMESEGIGISRVGRSEDQGYGAGYPLEYSIQDIRSFLHHQTSRRRRRSRSEYLPHDHCSET